MKTVRNILKVNGKKLEEQKIVIRFIRHWAKRHNVIITNEVARLWIQKYAEPLRRHYERASKNT